MTQPPTRETSAPVALALLTMLAACESYRAEPLDFARELEQSLATFEQETAKRGALDLSTALASLTRNNVDVVDKRGAYEAASAAATIGPQLPNPSLAVGPLLLVGPGISGSARHGVEAALEWVFPLSGRLSAIQGAQDAEAAASLAAWGAGLRQEYLELRADFVRLHFAQRRLALAQRQRELATNALSLQRVLVEGGNAQALDVSLAELERQRSTGAWLDAQAELFDAKARVATRCGLALAAVGTVPRSALPTREALETPPALDALQGALRANPSLTVLEAQYEVAESSLRLEIARQYPDLGIGPSYEREEGVDRWGLSIGIEIPLFDRNQAAIAAARARRKATRARYVAELRQALVRVASSRERIAVRERQLENVDTTLELAKQLASARSELASAGKLDALRALRIHREEVAALETALEVEASFFEAWIQLEHAVGVPLLSFPGHEAGQLLPQRLPR